MTFQSQEKSSFFSPKIVKMNFTFVSATEGIFYRIKSQRPLKYRECSQLSNEVRYDSVGPPQEALEQKENGPISLTHAAGRAL